MARYVYPSREFGPAQDNSDDNYQADHTHNYDSSATYSAINLQATTQRLLIPQSKPWAQIVIQSPLIDKLIGSQANPMLALANYTLNNHFSYSNFYNAAGEGLLDAILFGSACIAVIDRPGTPLSYYPIPIDQIYFLESWDGHVDVVFREHTLTARQLASRYPGKLPSNVQEDADNKPDAKHEIVESAIPDGKETRYAVYLKCDWTELESSTNKFSPFITWRWEKSLGSAWGGSPCRNALPHIRGVNRMMMSMLAAGEFNALGCWQSEDESLNGSMLKEKMVPGSVLPGVNLQPIPFPGNFTITQQLVEGERQQIRNLLFDVALQPQTPGQPNSYMSATEVAQRRDQFLQKVGQPAQRLQVEFLQPVANQAVSRLMERGDIQKPAPELLQVLVQNGVAIKDYGDIFHVEVNAAISSALKLAEAQNDLQILSSASAALAQIAPELRSAVKIEQLIPRMLVNMGMDADLVNSPEEMQAAQQAAQQAQQAQQMMQQAGALGDTGGKLNSALKPGSAIGNLVAGGMAAHAAGQQGQPTEQPALGKPQAPVRF